MIGRLLEDLVFAGRLGYFYYKAPQDVVSLGFSPTTLSKKQKFKYAWNKAQFKG